MRVHRQLFALALVALAPGVALGASGTVSRAADELALGEVAAAPGATVRLAVRLVDRSGTPLGTDQPFGDAIQAFALRVRTVPAEAVEAMTIRRAGPAAAKSPLFESSTRTSDGAALLASFEEAKAQLVPFADRRGLVIAEVEVRLAATLAPGTRVDLRLDPSVSVLGNQAGTVEENTANGWLRLRDGAIHIGPWVAERSE